ncbi:Putative succinate-semialdehyde dehydrogenase [NADP(+)] 2 [BD1-7 clade bacterium]|uniref:Aldehyde dehydrogenase n=1 Tax=BD1-7 clade bacterium TaxID=2029982 RepID=A0A5S9QFS6_9GAMM|nr:Putative succinate-semialdehyde dehydrogenase [NADP(+)] 2 [BD1-7 clade bacterium]CAA0117425.1 Putative succinate-semialdehyde dehydrogenase [NADP(+)] 2 [BD1-7 clade bacterium]
MAIVTQHTAEGSTQSVLRLHNPADQSFLYELPVATPADVEQAVAKAREAQKNWGALTVDNRVSYLLRLRDVIMESRDEIVQTVIGETGKPLQDAFVFEVLAVCDFITFYTKQARKLLKTKRRKVPGLLKFTKKVEVVYKPLGVVGVISPWNGPFVLTANPVIQALLAGNTVVAKGSEITPRSAGILQDLCERAGFPEGVCQVLVGDGMTGAALTSADVDKICFTGSVATGKKVATNCIEKLIPYTLELGGKDAMIVCADADLDDAAHGAVWGSCVNTGHYCCGTERIYVEAAIYDAFVSKCVALAKSLNQGQKHGFKEDLGAVFWDRQMTIIESHVADAIERGAVANTGGQRLSDRDGLYFPATVMTNVDESSDLIQKETFGPILPIIKVANIEEAIAKANDSCYGLHGNVWTKDIQKGRNIAARMETGSVSVNDISMIFGVPSAPFGGVKESGFGHSGGDEGLRSFCHAQPILFGRYGGHDVGYPYDEKSYKRLNKVLDFTYKNPVGKFFFG